jgi:predicted MarR family transcription regulator
MNPRLRKDLFALLHAAEGNAMKERRIATDLADVWLGTEIASELRRMEAEGYVTAGRNAVNEITWRLTATGQSAAAELGV